MATRKTNKNIWVIALIGIIAILFLIITKKQFQTTQNPNYNNPIATTYLSPTINTANPKTYYSEVMKITFNVPAGYKIEELGNFITVKNSYGEIIISRIGTNANSLKGYLIDIANYNRLKLTNKQNLKINNLDVIKVDINGKRNYLFYINNRVFSFETKSPSLYSDLDQIAQSFRFTP